MKNLDLALDRVIVGLVITLILSVGFAAGTFTDAYFLNKTIAARHEIMDRDTSTILEKAEYIDRQRQAYNKLYAEFKDARREMEFAYQLAENLTIQMRELQKTTSGKIVLQYLDGWDSLAEFEAFLATDNTDKINYASSPPFANGVGLCFLYAADLRYAAERESGKYISWQFFSPAEWKQITGETIDTWHGVVCVYVDGYIYFYEPQTDKQIPFKLRTILAGN